MSAPGRPTPAGSATTGEERRLRIAMATARAVPETGGVESHVSEVSTRLAQAGHDVTVLTTDRSRALPTHEVVDGVRVRRYAAHPAGRDWYASPGLALGVLLGRWDLVHVQGIHTLMPPLAMFAAWLRRVPFVVTFHTGGSSSAWRTRARRWQFAALAPLLRRAADLVAVSEFEARRFEQVLGWEHGRIRVIRNGGSLPAPDTSVEADPDLVVSLGRLEHYKGHHRVVAALPALARTRPGVRLEILGSGPHEGELLTLAERLGVADRVQVRFIPPPDRLEMARSLAGAGVVALISDYEAHPVAVMEALTVNRPVVVATTSGLSELVTAGWARGVDVHASGEELAAALNAQLEDPVQPEPGDLPTWEGCVAELQRVYAQATDRRVR